MMPRAKEAMNNPLALGLLHHCHHRTKAVFTWHAIAKPAVVAKSVPLVGGRRCLLGTTILVTVLITVFVTVYVTVLVTVL